MSTLVIVNLVIVIMTIFFLYLRAKRYTGRTTFTRYKNLSELYKEKDSSDKK